MGDCAEKLSLAFEERLFARTKMEKTQIEHTSDFDDSAGYDIKSKWRKNRKKNQERESFIEVKGRKYDEDSFIISNNELNVAKMKGEDYVIYFWKNLFEVLVIDNSDGDYLWRRSRRLSKYKGRHRRIGYWLDSLYSGSHGS